jgi:hypothetical protein
MHKLHIENCSYEVIGGIVFTGDPLSLIFKNNFVDKNRVTYGFNMPINCNYPEAYQLGEVRFEKNYFYTNSTGPF